MTASLSIINGGPLPGLAQELRRIADAVDSGLVTDAAMVFVQDDCYSYMWGASKFQCMGMAHLLLTQATARMRDDEP